MIEENNPEYMPDRIRRVVYGQDGRYHLTMKEGSWAWGNEYGDRMIDGHTVCGNSVIRFEEEAPTFNPKRDRERVTCATCRYYIDRGRQYLKPS
jgi:hypothetical protein